MSRRKAFFIHLGLSAALAGALLLIFALLLFPLPFFMEDGGWEGMRLIVAIDVILGPCLTLVVFNPLKSKRELSLDLGIIGLVQVSAFAFGLWNVYQVRTESVVFVDGTFYAMPADLAKNFPAPYRELIEKSDHRPAYAVISLPADRDRRQNLRIESLRNNIPLYNRFEYLGPLDKSAGAEFNLSIAPPEKLRSEGNAMEAVAKWAAAAGGKVEDYWFIPTMCRTRNILTVVRKSDVTVAGFVKDAKLVF